MTPDSPPIRIFDAATVQAPHRAAIDVAIQRVLDSNRYVLGDEVARFESAFADYCGVANAVGVANGSDALELALRAVGVGSGDKVVTVANAGGYSTTAIRRCGAVPLYADIDPSTLLASLDSIQGLYAQEPRAVVVTHLYGCLAPVETVIAECAARGIPVVEDCAQAHGARRGDRRAGSFGDIGCFSFYPTKNLGALGDGGAVVTSRNDLADRVRSLRQYGWTSKYRVERAHGCNSRLDEIQAAILNVKLPTLDEENSRRRGIAQRYRDQIRHPEISILAGRGGDDDVAHLFVLLAQRRDALRAHLSAYGVDTDVHYPIPDHLQPAWHSIGGHSLPATELAATQVLTIPCYPGLGEDAVQRVVSVVNDFV